MLAITVCLSTLYLVSCVVSAPALSNLSSAPAVPKSSSAPTSISTASSASSAAEPTATVPFASTYSNGPLWGLDSGTPAPIRESYGAPILGPDNLPIDQENPDLFAPPTTDAGSLSNAKWPFSLSHNRLQTGGWARQQNIGVLPLATSMAAVNMRLEAGAIRELHWHSTSEWAYVLSGTTQVTAVNSDGQNFLANVGPGDLWFFPPGIPHSLQATNDSADGSEFILVFDDGAFSEDSTFLLTDWLAHVPAEVIQKNFQANPDAFSHIPAQQLYIFPSSPPPVDAVAPSSPQGGVANPYSFAMSKVNGTKLAGGSVKIVDSTTFTVSTTIAAAEVTVEPGAMRELHWHPTMDEWSFFLEGTGRVTIFAAQGNARTFNYQPGDIGFVPTAMGHYVENTGNTTLKYLEIFNTDRFQDISLNQWLALTPPDLVKAHLQLSDETIARLSKTKPVVVG
ncbi:putative oxalate decarboxylase/oxidase [Mycena galericulata]|nr:putative oxalate decarboxylase/oxidase [Mycena galericulata]KAJ7505601.1 putative oxalate decarboxylase/oxidase [Mycena galericulata]